MSQKLHPVLQLPMSTAPDKLQALVKQQQILLNKAASLLGEAALTEDGIDGDQALDLVDAINNGFKDIGITSTDGALNRLYEAVCAAAGVSNEDEICAIKALKMISDRAAAHERRFIDACADLGHINEVLGLDPDDGGADPIIGAIEKLQACALGRAAVDVVAERARQVAAKGWDHEHDDAHQNDEIAALAAVYAMPEAARDWPAEETGYGKTFAEALCPFGWAPKFGGRRRDLVKAGALILAEIERLDRAAEGGVPQQEINDE